MVRFAIVLTVLALAAAPVVSGKGKGKGKGNQQREESGRAYNAADRRFLPEEVGIVLGYYRSGQQPAPGTGQTRRRSSARFGEATAAQRAASAGA